MTALSIVALIVCVSTSWSCRYPDWPGEFKWSFSGPVDGWACTRIPEPADPNKWTDNYFCHKSLPGIVGVGMRWSYAGAISGMKCTKITEHHQPLSHGWTDNFFCVPANSSFNFMWGELGPVYGKTCIEWKEPADSDWRDNFLCRA